jgi:hypothetical protein
MNKINEKYDYILYIIKFFFLVKISFLAQKMDYQYKYP